MLNFAGKIWIKQDSVARSRQVYMELIVEALLIL
jgi:hypothetical protein